MGVPAESLSARRRSSGGLSVAAGTFGNPLGAPAPNLAALREELP